MTDEELVENNRLHARIDELQMETKVLNEEISRLKVMINNLQDSDKEPLYDLEYYDSLNKHR